MENGTHKDFLDKLTLALNHENERRAGSDTPLLDVAFLVAPVEQHIAEPQFEEFGRYLAAGEYSIQYIGSSEEDYGYTNGTVQVFSGSDDMVGVYILAFGVDERPWGYCICSPQKEGYDPEHRCCGDGCDWVAPAFILEKRRVVGRGDWNGIERDYWAYEDAFNAKLAALNADLDRAKKERKAEHLRSEIARLQEQLREVG